MTDREKLIELIGQVQYLGGLELALADHLLANGVTIPVKCKDCKFWECGTCKLHSEEPDQYSVGLSVVMMGTDFCSYGEPA